MKRWLSRVIVLALTVAAVFWAWSALFPGPEKAIRKRLSNLAKAVSVDGNEGQIARLAKAQSLASFFTPDVEVTVEVPGYHIDSIQSREELLQVALAARSRGSPLKVEIVDVSVTVAPDGKSAEAHFTGKAQVSGERSIQAQEIQARFVKVERDWLIRHVQTVKTLR